MLHDKLEDPNAAASFSGVLLRPAQVAAEVEGLLDNPRPVLAIPRRRAVLARILDLAPGLMLRVVDRVLAQGRRRQRKYLRRAKAGKLPR